MGLPERKNSKNSTSAISVPAATYADSLGGCPIKNQSISMEYCLHHASLPGAAPSGNLLFGHPVAARSGKGSFMQLADPWRLYILQCSIYRVHLEHVCHIAALYRYHCAQGLRYD